MITIRRKIRKLLFTPFIFTFFLTLIFVIIVHNSLLRYQFYDGSSINSNNNNDNIPGRYLMNWSQNTSYCDLRYGLPDEFLYEETDLEFSPEQKNSSSFRVIYDVIKGVQDSNTSIGVTYATHVTADFINYIAEIVRFWDGPISVAAFVPDSDADLTIRQLNQLCRCIPEMSKVSVHFVFPADLPPYLQNQPLYEAPQNCQITDSSKLPTYRFYSDLSYPVNVCRNVARNATITSHVLVTDIQMIPSKGLARRFLEMLEIFGLKNNLHPSYVFVVPIFEVSSDVSIPRTKKELIKLVKKEKAVYFHRFSCSHCQKFPGIRLWLSAYNPSEVVKPFLTVKREYPFHRWEPLYIGTKNEPLYPELLSWEGFQDKMTQMLEMCLTGYKYVILDGAFLVHWPGIKKKKYKFDSIWRTPFRKQNSRQYKDIVKKLGKKYPKNPKCKLQ